MRALPFLTQVCKPTNVCGWRVMRPVLHLCTHTLALHTVAHSPASLAGTAFRSIIDLYGLPFPASVSLSMSPLSYTTHCDWSGFPAPSCEWGACSQDHVWKLVVGLRHQAGPKITRARREAAVIFAAAPCAHGMQRLLTAPHKRWLCHASGFHAYTGKPGCLLRTFFGFQSFRARGYYTTTIRWSLILRNVIH